MESKQPGDSPERVGSISFDVDVDVDVPAGESAAADGLGQEPASPTRRQALIAAGALLGGATAWWLTRNEGPAPAKAREAAPVGSGPRPLWTYRGAERMTVAHLTEPPPLPVFATSSELVTLDPATGAVRRRIRVADDGAMTDHGPIGSFPGGDSLLLGADRVFDSRIGQVSSYHLTDAGADWRLAMPEQLGGATSHPTLACCDGATLYGFIDSFGGAGDPDRVRFALSVDSRRLLWSRAEDPGDVLLELVAAPGRRLVGRSSTNNLVAVNAVTGDRLWTVRADGQLSWCAANKEIVCIGTGDGALRVVRLADGTDSWLLAPQPGENWRCLRPLVAEDAVYVLRDNGEVSRHAAGDGRLLWSCRLPFRLDARCRPVLADGLLFVPGPASGGVCAIDAEHGTVRWTFRDSGPGVDVWSVSLGEGRLFAGHDALMYAVPLTGAAAARSATPSCLTPGQSSAAAACLMA